MMIILIIHIHKKTILTYSNNLKEKKHLSRIQSNNRVYAFVYILNFDFFPSIICWNFSFEIACVQLLQVLQLLQI